MQKQSLQVSLFWDNQPLSKLEHLTIASYSDHFDKINIFTYAPALFNAWKSSKVNIYDASEIIDESHKFYYNGHGDCPKQSVVGFSDIFRYQLLSVVGNWYSDFDVTCLKPFTFTDSDTVIRSHYKYSGISNICKFKKDDDILKSLYTLTRYSVYKDNKEWDLPLRIFDETIKKYQYEKYIVKDYLCDDNFNRCIKPLLIDSISKVDLSGRYAIHWCRSAITSGNWSTTHCYDVNNPYPGTYLNMLYSKYNL